LDNHVAIAANGKMSDIKAINQADVSICSYDSVDIVKQKCDIVIKDFNFDNLYASLMMGK
jgi:magnesium-transporting ATPase (P-type)